MPKVQVKRKIYWQNRTQFKNQIYTTQSYVNNKQTKRATGFHFNLPGHRISDMEVNILEKVKYNTEA